MKKFFCCLLLVFSTPAFSAGIDLGKIDTLGPQSDGKPAIRDDSAETICDTFFGKDCSIGPHFGGNTGAKGSMDAGMLDKSPSVAIPEQSGDAIDNIDAESMCDTFFGNNHCYQGPRDPSMR